MVCNYIMVLRNPPLDVLREMCALTCTNGKCHKDLQCQKKSEDFVIERELYSIAIGE